MKKLFYLLLLVYSGIFAQVSSGMEQEFDYGIKNNSSQKILVPDTLVTRGADGTYGHTSANLLPVSTATTNALELETNVSAGAVSGFTLTNNGNGTVNISSGIAYLRATNDPYASIIKYPIAAVTNLALTDNANNYVLVDYNGGSPTLTVTTNGSTINTQTNSLAFLIARVGNNLDYLSLVGQNVDPNAKLRVRFLNQEGIRRASGAVLGFSNRNLTLTSSVLFSGLIRVNAAAFNTASPDTFTLAYNNGSAWTRTTGQTQINNTQYNNAGTLTDLPNNHFRTDYVYLLPNNPSKLYVIMGTTTYSSLTLAKTAPRPSILPVELQVIGLEVGRLFIEKNSTTIAEVQSSFANDFVGAPVPEHNALTGLQGGTAGEYNHLTNAQVALVNNSEQTTNKSSSYTASSTETYADTKAVVDGLEISDLYNRGNAIKPTTTKKYGLLVAGQSNTDGRVPLANAPVWLNQADPVLTGVNMYNRNTGLFEPFKLGVNTGADNNADTRWAYDMVAYYLLQGYLADNIYVVKRSKGGTPISTLSATNGGFWEAKQELITAPPKLLGDLEAQYIAAKKANPDFEIRAFLWHQGESDSDNATSIANYYQNFKNVITYVRGFTGNPRLPIVFGTVSTLSAQYNATIKAAQLQIAAEDPFAYVVDMGSAALLDAYHFNATSSESLGTSMYNIIKDFTDTTLSTTAAINNKIDKVSGQTNKLAKFNSDGGLSPTLLSDDGTTITSLGDFSIKGITLGAGSGGISNTVLAYNTNPTSTGINNTFLGYENGRVNTTGNSNTFVGRRAGYSNTTGSANTITGLNAGLLLTTSSSNSIYGYQAGTNMTSGIDNLIGGYQSAMFTSASANNTALDKSVILGAIAKPFASGDTNEIVIGYDSRGLGPNTSVLGNSSTIFFRPWGRLLVGKSTDDGINDGQFNSTVSSGNTTLGTSQPTANNQLTRKDYVDTGLALKANLASPAFTGTPTAPTATAGDNSTKIATTAFVQNVARPYKVYTALLSQSGTNAPTAIVLENTLGGTVTWSRTVPGGYFATLSNAFTTDKTTVLITNGSTNGNYIHGAAVSTTNVNIIAPNDGQIDRATIEIRVYN